MTDPLPFAQTLPSSSKRPLCLAPIFLLLCLSACSTTAPRASIPDESSTPSTKTDRPPLKRSTPTKHTLSADGRWLLTAPETPRLDASALLRLPNGTLLTVNDKSLPPWEIRLGEPPEATLISRPDLFPAEQRDKLQPPKEHPYDSEGLAMDDRGRIYLCEEADRWILRHDPTTGQVERLDIDWSPVSRWFHPVDRNASFEGIAAGGNKLYVANERSTGRIIVVDIPSLKVIDDFQVSPPGRPALDVHYSDLSWFEEHLWVLCRQSRCILEVDPVTRNVLAEYDYRALELDRENAYRTMIPFGMAEGLSIDSTHIWILIDNNGLPRRMDRSDRRPLLLRCPRPSAVHSPVPNPLPNL